MRTTIKTLAFAAIVFFAACGPSAEELAEKAKQDSIRIADSIATVEAAAAAAAAAEQAKLDSIAKVEREKFVADSIAAAEANKGGKKGK
jgi:hypothetical protein